MKKYGILAVLALTLTGCPSVGGPSSMGPAYQVAPAQWRARQYAPYPSQVYRPPVDRRPIWEQYPNNAGWVNLND
jgi:hypothetical protein